MESSNRPQPPESLAATGRRASRVSPKRLLNRNANSIGNSVSTWVIRGALWAYPSMMKERALYVSFGQRRCCGKNLTGHLS